jgi:hypothetical protein
LIVVTDAAFLADDVRGTVVTGCFVVCSIFLVFHSIERLLDRGAFPGIMLKKGDAEARIGLDSSAYQKQLSLNTTREKAGTHENQE